MNTLLISEVFPPRVGGTARWFYEVYSRYPAGEAFVLTDYQRGDEEADKHSTLPLIRTPLNMEDWGFLRKQSAAQYWHYMQVARKLVRKENIHAVHCARVMPEGVIAYLLRKVSGVQYCVYAHGEEIGTALSSRQLTLLMKLVYRNAGTIIANSQCTRILLRKVGVPDDKISIISPGVDTSRFNPDGADVSRKQLGLWGYTVLLSVGRLQRRKGHDMVIKALPSLAARVPNIRYVIVGVGEEEAKLLEAAKKTHVDHLVHFAGRVPEDQLPDFYRACDMFVLPNREDINQDIEGFGIVFLEANACAKPVIGGRSGGTSDAIIQGETGLLVNGENPQEIADAIFELAGNRAKAAEMGLRGRTRAIESFGWEGITQKIRQVV
jgi:phosphatidyl-myo-inositol dimannoside synthase